MYSLNITDISEEDILNTVTYIVDVLKAPMAANNFRKRRLNRNHGRHGNRLSSPCPFRAFCGMFALSNVSLASFAGGTRDFVNIKFGVSHLLPLPSPGCGLLLCASLR
jgi:hypothetical protein